MSAAAGYQFSFELSPERVLVVSLDEGLATVVRQYAAARGVDEAEAIYLLVHYGSEYLKHGGDPFVVVLPDAGLDPLYPVERLSRD